MFSVVLLGTGTAIPRPDRGSPGLAWFVGDEHWVMDSGPGAFRQLATYGVPVWQVDRAIYTHFHPDHTIDIVHALFALNNPDLPEPAGALDVVGPRGYLEYYAALKQAYGSWITGVNFDLTVREWWEGAHEVGPAIVHARHVEHTPASLAYRIEYEGRSAVFTGDVDYCDAIVELSDGADLLICECSHPNAQKVPGHASPGVAGRIASEAKVGTLVLTHFYPPCLDGRADIAAEARAAFAGELVLGTDLLRIDI